MTAAYHTCVHSARDPGMMTLVTVTIGEIYGMVLRPYINIVYADHIPRKYNILWVTTGSVTSACVSVH